jgi:hypothetical protein
VPAARGVPPGWVAEDRPRTTVGPMLIIMLAALVTVLAWLFGKNFLFSSI